MREIRRILIPTDGSEYSREAVEVGLALAQQLGAQVTALYVVDQTTFANFQPDSAIITVYSMLEKEGRAAVDEVRRRGEELGVKVEVQLVEGSPTRRIVELASNFDLIVMGTLGRSGVAKLVLGSVAERVVRFAPCPVLVARSPQGR